MATWQLPTGRTVELARLEASDLQSHTHSFVRLLQDIPAVGINWNDWVDDCITHRVTRFDREYSFAVWDVAEPSSRHLVAFQIAHVDPPTSKLENYPGNAVYLSKTSTEESFRGQGLFKHVFACTMKTASVMERPVFTRVAVDNKPMLHIFGKSMGKLLGSPGPAIAAWASPPDGLPHVVFEWDASDVTALVDGWRKSEPVVMGRVDSVC